LGLLWMEKGKRKSLACGSSRPTRAAGEKSRRGCGQNPGQPPEGVTPSQALRSLGGVRGISQSSPHLKDPFPAGIKKPFLEDLSLGAFPLTLVLTLVVGSFPEQGLLSLLRATLITYRGAKRAIKCRSGPSPKISFTPRIALRRSRIFFRVSTT
jgi:hypothetical protein